MSTPGRRVFLSRLALGLFGLALQQEKQVLSDFVHRDGCYPLRHLVRRVCTVRQGRTCLYCCSKQIVVNTKKLGERALRSGECPKTCGHWRFARLFRDIVETDSREPAEVERTVV